MKWKGREINPPLVIVTRLCLYPFLFLFTCFICFILLVGWGADEATDVWGRLIG